MSTKSASNCEKVDDVAIREVGSPERDEQQSAANTLTMKNMQKMPMRKPKIRRGAQNMGKKMLCPAAAIRRARVYKSGGLMRSQRQSHADNGGWYGSAGALKCSNEAITSDNGVKECRHGSNKTHRIGKGSHGSTRRQRKTCSSHQTPRTRRLRKKLCHKVHQRTRARSR
jgi:hypothetical protein